jgi:septal ring factor EnvC (AmiA/AmiB activator)
MEPEELSTMPSEDEELVSKFAEQLKTSQWELDNMEGKISDMNRETEVLYKALADISDIRPSYLGNMYRSGSNLDEVTSSVRSRYTELEQNYLKEFARKDKVISLKGVEVEIAKGMSAILQETVDAQALAAKELETKNTDLLANFEQKKQDFELQSTELLEKLAQKEQGIFFVLK